MFITINNRVRKKSGFPIDIATFALQENISVDNLPKMLVMSVLIVPTLLLSIIIFSLVAASRLVWVTNVKWLRLTTSQTNYKEIGFLRFFEWQFFLA
jgi:hypothetical protein